MEEASLRSFPYPRQTTIVAGKHHAGGKKKEDSGFLSQSQKARQHGKRGDQNGAQGQKTGDQTHKAAGKAAESAPYRHADDQPCAGDSDAFSAF